MSIEAGARSWMMAWRGTEGRRPAPPALLPSLQCSWHLPAPRSPSASRSSIVTERQRPIAVPIPSNPATEPPLARRTREKRHAPRPNNTPQTPARPNMQAFAGQRVAARTGLAAAAPRRVLVIEAAHKKGQSTNGVARRSEHQQSARGPPAPRSRGRRAPRSSRNSPRPMRREVPLGATWRPGARTAGLGAHRRARAAMAAPLWSPFPAPSVEGSEPPLPPTANGRRGRRDGAAPLSLPRGHLPRPCRPGSILTRHTCT